MPPVLLVYTSIRYRLPRFSPKTILYHDAVKIQLPPPGGDGATRRVADPWWGHPPDNTSPDVMGAAEGGCCTPGALCVVASCTSFASGQARSLSRFAAPPSPCKGKPLHGNPCSKKASQTPKGNPLATVSHDHAATQPSTVSHRAERTCVSAQPSSADACNVGIRCSDDVMLQHIPRKGRRGRRPLQSVCAAQPTYTYCPTERYAKRVCGCRC